MRTPFAVSPRTNQVCCRVAGYAAMRADAEQLAALRRQPGPICGEPLSVSFLKHADPQTVAGMAAIYHAIANFKLSDIPFADWGVIGAPCFLGRAAMVLAMQRFAAEGAWGISPHLVPHNSVHAISGTASQALGIRGPNFGIGGGPGAAAEAFTMAATLLACENLPGLWLVLTGYDPEYIPEGPDQSQANATARADCIALALALIPEPIIPDHKTSEVFRLRKSELIGDQLTLRINPTSSEGSVHEASEFRLGNLVNRFARNDPPAGPWRLGGGGWFAFARSQPENCCD
jgi:hypothetical protein